MPSKTILNKKKYLKAPTASQINSFIAELEVSAAQFERFYGIPNGTIKQVNTGNRELPAKFWHIIYEKMKPAYGSGFLDPTKREQPMVTNKVTIKRENPVISRKTGTALDDLL